MKKFEKLDLDKFKKLPNEKIRYVFGGGSKQTPVTTATNPNEGDPAECDCDCPEN